MWLLWAVIDRSGAGGRRIERPIRPHWRGWLEAKETPWRSCMTATPGRFYSLALRILGDATEAEDSEAIGCKLATASPSPRAIRASAA